MQSSIHSTIGNRILWKSSEFIIWNFQTKNGNLLISQAITFCGPRLISEEMPKVTTSVSTLFLSDTDGLISQSLLTGNFEAAVEMCLHDNRLADAILLAIAGGPELLAKTQRKYFKKTKSNVSRVSI